MWILKQYNHSLKNLWLNKNDQVLQRHSIKKKCLAIHREAYVSWTQYALAHNKQNWSVTEFYHLIKTNFFFQILASGSLPEYKQTSEFSIEGTNHPPEL